MTIRAQNAGSRDRRPVTRRRPAELAGAGATLAGIVGAALIGDWRFAAGAAAGLVPAAVTYLRTHGGVVGTLRGLVYGEE